MFDLVPVFLTFRCFALISVFFMAYCKLRPEKAARFAESVYEDPTAESLRAML